MENEIVDGTISYTVRGGDHDGEKHSVDLYIVSMIVRELEKLPEFQPAEMSQDEKAEKGLDLEKSFFRSTPEFACELSRRIEKYFGFCTPSIAQSLWSKLDEFHAKLKKNTDESPS